MKKKNFIICFIFFVSFYKAFSQVPENILYKTNWQYSFLIKVDTLWIKSVPITIEYQMTSSRDSSISFFSDDSAMDTNSVKNLDNAQVDMSLDINMPQKIVFNGKDIITYQNGIKTIKEAAYRVFKPINEYKNIEGFRCRKYEILGDSIGVSFAWICKDLPATITPVGFLNTPGAILGYENSQKSINIILLKIKLESLP
ncbi:MAG TPA: hypothetical protein PKC62_02155 [Ferruginibacter sp.]|jgi:GLPGLI family protein|nr:hypothetical protein [Bacteroidota bacterium]MBS1926870.1 hypothetical protein [Bacteroidota bacterium]MCC6692099.1 hypothetical protein [Chitinophagaceae bacterium]HMT95464.1 hypothetical protein [Ferruginibacter sp.]HMU24614.1 hypothetical protein [Ferruginibacter sp.]